MNAAAQLAVSTNPSKLRHPRRTLADVVLSAALEMSHEPPAQRAEALTAPQNAAAQLRASVCDTLGKNASGPPIPLPVSEPLLEAMDR